MFKMRNYVKLMVLLLTVLYGCAGADYMPVYFESKKTSEDTAPDKEKPSENVATGSCTVNFTSKLCVSIYGDSVQVGTDGKEALCADLDPIPIEVNGGTNLILRGSTFPDIPFEGHGLPAPITINGKGTSDGTQNIGKGKIDEAGNVSIEGFSLFINALGMVGELPGLTFTSGKPDPLEGLPEEEGAPLGSDGHLKLIISTVIGSLFPAADEKLMGASLHAVFDGTVNPPLSECKGESSKPQSTFVTKLVVEDGGEETEGLLPGETRLEVGKAFIADSPQDIGPNFETFSKFKIVNATAKAISIDIPAIVGPFYIESLRGGALKQDLPPKTPLIIKIAFRPDKNNVKKEGEVSEMLSIGPDVYQLIGDAVNPSGSVSVGLVDDSGKGTVAQDTIKLGDVTVSTTGRRDFFSCKQITCDGVEKPTQCIPCVDVLINVCQLLPVDKDGNPIGTVDSNCKPEFPGGKDSYAIGLAGNAVIPKKQVVEIKNTGVKPLTIKTVEIQEVQGSKSTGQFKVSSQVVLPLTISPANISNEFLRVTVIYEPNDLIGFDGSSASVGHPVKDRAILHVVTDNGSTSVELSGTTTVKETPALQVFFKSATGIKELSDGSEFAFRGLTMETVDLAVPVFVKLSDSAATPIRVTKFVVNNGNGTFEWLDTKEKINAKPDNSRCAIPVFDANGNQTSRITDLNPTSLLPNGFDLKPGSYTTDNMPLFGCVNFHMGSEKKRQYKATLNIATVELNRDGQPARNSDGSLKQTSLNINLLAVINPLKGKVVFRTTQTMAAIMNPQFPGVSASSSKKELDLQIADGLAKESDQVMILGAMTFDPFDEETIKDEEGNILTVPGDGVTAIYRKVDTHPVSQTYDDPLLPPYTSLISDSTKGLFFDYPSVPEDYKVGGLRIFTGSLSYPGPLADPDKRSENISLCEEVNPCSEEGQRKMGEGTNMPGKRGVCAFFYTSAGEWSSPSMHYSSETEGGERKNLCDAVDKPQKLKDMKGYYNLNGEVTFGDVALKFWGPTYFNNPSGPLGPVPPLDAVFHITFTTGVLAPNSLVAPTDVIPDKRVNLSKLEYKINLTDTKLETPRLCDTSVKNRYIHGEYYSTWKYLEPLLVKDEAGTAPAGCPESDNSFTGGSAYLRGRPLDQSTGITTVVAVGKFEDNDSLTFAFKDVMFFVVFNGWFCDPNGPEDQFEGSHCYDKTVNERDNLSTISIVK